MESLRRLISLDVKSALDAVCLETDWHYRSLGAFGYGSLCNQKVYAPKQGIKLTGLV
jgi:hypothetical protein